MRRPALLLVILALSSCGDSESDSDRSPVTSTPGPTGASGAGSVPKSAGRAPSRSGEDGGAQPGATGRAFDRSTVKVSFVDTSVPFGVKSAVVYFVARGPSSGWLGQAEACARQYLSKAPSAYCFAFSSERAFRYSRVSRRPPAKMRRPCWSAYWGKPKGRRPIKSAENPAASALRCPS